MKGQLFFSFFIAAAFLEMMKAQIQLGEGQKCEFNRDCKILWESVCRNGECKCRENYILSNDSSECLLLANEVGWGCEEDVQCTTKLNSTTECRGNICLCKPETIINHMGSCIPIKELMALCSSDDICTTENSMCQQGVCACKEGFVADVFSKNCLELAQSFKSPCKEAIQCTQAFGQHAICSKNKECICKANHHFTNLHCWEDRGLNETCETSDECYILEDGANQTLQCSASQCVCKPEYVADLNTLRCTSGATAATISGFFFALLALLLLV